MRQDRNKVSQEAKKNSGSTMTGTNLYATWYEFKKDLEERLGFRLLNWPWLKVKPDSPLPWDDSHMEVVLSVVARMPKLGGIVKDRCHE